MRWYTAALIEFPNSAQRRSDEGIPFSIWHPCLLNLCLRTVWLTMGGVHQNVPLRVAAFAEGAVGTSCLQVDPGTFKD